MRFRLLNRLARGRDSTVWHALDRARGGVVAVKIPDAGTRLTPVPPTPSHPFLLRVFDSNERHLAMELAAGGSARDYTAERYGSHSSDIRAVFVATLGAQIATALGALHERGLLHLDVTPDNVVICYDECRRGRYRPTARLADFDLVQKVGNLSARGVVQGTPAFMSPEQNAGEVLTPTSDLYALGATLAALLPHHRYVDEGSSPSPLETGLRGLIASLLSSRPDQRPADAATVQRSLESLIGSLVASMPLGQRLIGRTAPHRRLTALVESAGSGDGAVVIVSGQTGVGRSTVLTRVAGIAAALKLSVRSGVGSAERHADIRLIDDVESLTGSDWRKVDALVRNLRDSGNRSVIVLAVATDRVTSTSTKRIQSLARLGPLHRVEIESFSAPELKQHLQLNQLRDDTSDNDVRLSFCRSGGRPGLMKSSRRSTVTARLDRLLGALPARQRYLIRRLSLAQAPVPPSALAKFKTELTRLVDRGLCRRHQRKVFVIDALSDFARQTLPRRDRIRLARSFLHSIPPQTDTRIILELSLAGEYVNSIQELLVVTFEELAADARHEELQELMERVAGMKRLAPTSRACARALFVRSLAGAGEHGRAEAAALAHLRAAKNDRTDESTIECLLAAGLAARMTGRHLEAGARYEGALSVAETTDRPELIALSLTGLGRTRKAASITRNVRPPQHRLRLLLARGDAARFFDATGSARAAYRQAARLARERGDTNTAAIALQRMGNLAHEAGSTKSARSLWRRALELTGDSPHRRISLRNALGIVDATEQHPEEAAEHFRAAAALSRGSGRSLSELTALCNIVTVESELLRVEAAFFASRRARWLTAELDARPAEVLLLTNIIDLNRLLGDDVALESNLSALLATSTEPSGNRHVAMARRHHAEVLLRRSLVFPRFRKNAVRLLDDLQAELEARLPTAEVTLQVRIDRLSLETPNSATVVRLQELQQTATTIGSKLGLRRANRALLEHVLAHRDTARVREHAEASVRDAPQTPLSEFCLFEHALLARLSGHVDDQRRVLDTVERIRFCLGPTYEPGFLSRPDVARAVADAVLAIVDHDLPAALAATHLLEHCPAFSWRVDARLAEKAGRDGQPGVAFFHSERARDTLTAAPAIAFEAGIDPKQQSLLRLLVATG